MRAPTARSTDVIDGNVPATFTDDPQDPATLAELQKAGGKFAYIPISVSSTEIAFVGEAGVRNGELAFGHTAALVPADPGAGRPAC